MSHELPGLPRYPQAASPVAPPVENGVVGTVQRSPASLTTAEMLRMSDARPSVSRRSLLMIVGSIALLVFVWWWRQPDWPGPVALAEPVQTAVTIEAVEHDGFTLQPLAHFDVEGIVVGRQRYRLGREGDLSPYDIGLVWGIAAQPDLMRVINYRQSSRFLWWRYRGQLPVGEDEMNRAMANIHTVPKNGAIRRQLARLRPGQVARLQGYLLSITAADGWHWNSSMTREDTGNGACEVMLVESVELVERRVGR
jgi:hypothetical protein